MDPHYAIQDTSEIITPALLIYRELLEANLKKMIKIAGAPPRLRPHCKTHKVQEVAELELKLGITKHKCATFAEAEMLANAGARDIMLAYNPVGPNIARAVVFVKKFPEITFSVTADHPKPIAELGRALADADRCLDVLLDIDTGLHRTGVEVGEPAEGLYKQIMETQGLNPGGLHVYDGHHHEESREQRQAGINADWEKVIAFRDDLRAHGWPVPRIVAGGTGSFSIYAEKDDPTIEVSPGTCVYNDAGYSACFPDLVFTPAALVLTRVISRPTPNRICLDLGSKAVASDPPAGNRVVFADLPDAKHLLQNEEHLVLQTSRADEFEPGDELYGMPWHICPTSALHRQVFVIANGKLSERWDVVARDRWLKV